MAHDARRGERAASALGDPGDAGRVAAAFDPLRTRGLTTARTRAWSPSSPGRAWQGCACSAIDAIPDGAARRGAGCAQASVERPSDTRREPGRSAANGGLDLSIDRFCPHIASCLQPRSHPASPINAPQGVRRLRNTDAHLLHPSAEAAQGEPHAPDHHRAHNLRHAEISRLYFDLQSPAGGMTLALLW